MRHEIPQSLMAALGVLTRQELASIFEAATELQERRWHDLHRGKRMQGHRAYRAKRRRSR